MLSDVAAAIFDMDGVLIDSFRAHYRSWARMARDEGLEFTEADFQKTFGRTSREIIASYWGKELSPQRIAAMDANKEVLFREIIEAEFPAMPGAVALLGALHHAGFRLAVGSSGPPENVELMLDRMNVRGLFGAVCDWKRRNPRQARSAGLPGCRRAIGGAAGPMRGDRRRSGGHRGGGRRRYGWNRPDEHRPHARDARRG